MAYDKPYEHKPGFGSIFNNADKKEDWQGDMTGKFMLPDGKLHYINAFNLVDKNGKAYLKLKIGKEVQSGGQAYSAAHKPFPAQDNHNKAKANGFVDLDEDIPF